MNILAYVVIFVLVGMVIGKLVKEESVAYGLIGIITVIWFFLMGPWAIATFFELVIGYNLVTDGMSKSKQGSDPKQRSETFISRLADEFLENDSTDSWFAIIFWGLVIVIFALFGLY